MVNSVGAFLDLLEANILCGRDLTTLQNELMQTMPANADHGVNGDDEIHG
ncbi:hypothetical protein SRABI111_00813 [Pseudomonas carnis]|nr:hypothetical protein SRABI08_00570 [Pseudomonas carnis]CAH0155462.1 hypothetical protein SRABI111_00813 [Pseudomonas carnis]CAH0215186.1 hypothetical protein SRABI64_02080 [Pseudomonas carnis]CAH0228133.1 hypothetical protein SRABI110_02661 [Pseudomonas carnis]